MATLTHAQYNSPMPLYSRDNVQEVLDQVTGYPVRPHSAMSGGSFDPSHSHVYRYLQSGGQLPAAHSARYDDEAGSDHPRYRGFVDPNVQSPSFKRLQYVTGVDSGAEDEISHEVHPPPRAHTEGVHSSSHQTTTTQHTKTAEGQPIALGYAPIGGGQQQQHSQQQDYQRQQYEQQQHQYQQQQQQQQYQQQHHEQSTRTHYGEDLGGPPVAQRDPTVEDTERDHPLDPTFAARIAEAERPKVPPPVVPSWTRFAEKKHERWQQYKGQSESQQPPRTVQYYRPPQPHSAYQPSYTLDASRAAQDKWQTHYAPYRFETGATAAAQERPRSRSVEPAHVPHRPYGGPKEWMKPFIAPNLRRNYGEGFAPPAHPSYSPLSSGRTYVSSTTTKQDYGQYGGQTGLGANPQHGGQTYSSLSTSSQQQQQQSQQSQFGTSGYTPSQPGGTHTTSTYDYTSTITHGGTTGTGGSVSQPVAPAPSSGLSSAKDSQYSRTVYESRKETGTSGTQQQQAIAAPWTGSQSHRTETQSHSTFQSENEARRQRQLMEQEVMKRAASAGPTTGRQVNTTTTVSTRPVSQDNRVTTFTTTTGGAPPAGPRWQQAPGSETKNQTSGSYIDEHGNVVNYTKEVYTSSDPGKEFSMLTEQEKKVLEEPLQPGVVSRHITTKYYKKSTFTSSTTTSTSQTPPVTSTVTRQAITGGPSASGRRF